MIIARQKSESIVATHNRNKYKDTIQFDSTTMRLESIINKETGIENAYILLGETKIDKCKTERDHSEKLNVKSIKSILSTLKKLKIKPIFISSEYI